MESIQQRDSQWRQEEAAMEPWANARIDPHDLFPSYPPIEALGGGAISDIHQFRSTTPEDSPTSNRGGISGANTENFELSGLEIDINTFDDSWTPFRLPGTYKLLGSFNVGSEKVNEDVKLVNSPPWDNIDKRASTKPVSLDSSFYSTQYENKLPGELPLSTWSLPSARPPSTCTSVSSMPLSALVLNQHESDLYSGSEAQHTSSIKFQSQVTGPASSSDPTSCPKARPRASKPKLKTPCINCKTRRVKCDESKPGCNKCVRSGRICDGYSAYKRSVEFLPPSYPPSGSSSSSTASIISTPSLSWSASSVAESDELLNTDLKLPIDRQQGIKNLGRARPRHLRIACLACQNSKTRCRCPPFPKQPESSSRPVESRPLGQVAEFASSGSKIDSYQIPLQQIGSLSPLSAHITRCTRNLDHEMQELTSTNLAKSNLSMDEPRLFEKNWVGSPPRHTQNLSSGVIGTEASHNDRSIPSDTWDDGPIIGEFVYGYHLDQEAQKVDEKVLKFDKFSRPFNEPIHLQRQKNITNVPSWVPTWPTPFNTEWPEAGRLHPMFLEQGLTEPAELPVFPTYSRKALLELEPFKSPTPFNANHPRYCPSVSSLGNFHLPPNMSKSARSSVASIIYPGSSSTLQVSDELSFASKCSCGIEPNGNKVNDRSSNFRGDHNTGPCRGFFSYQYPETTEAYPYPCSNSSENIGNKKKLFTGTDNIRVRSSYPYVTINFRAEYSYKKKQQSLLNHKSPSKIVSEAEQGDHAPSPSFDPFCNILLNTAALLETKDLPPARFPEHQLPSSEVWHSSENLLENPAVHDQLQGHSTILSKDEQTFTNCQMEDSDRPSSPTLYDTMAIEPIRSVNGGSSSSRSNTLSYFTEDETDWGEDEFNNSVQDLDFSNFSSISQEDCYSQAQVKDTLTRPVFSPMKQALIDRIMKEFWIIFNQETEGIQNRSPATLLDEVADNHKCNTDTNCESGEDSSQNSGSKSSVQTNNRREKSTQSSLGPRKRDDGDDQEQNDGEEQSPKRPRTLLTPPHNPEDTAKFACPYRKRDPRKYCVQFWRSCALTPQDTVARVKGHLYRHHRIYPCQRCKALFENQDAVNQHLMQRDVCELRDTENVDGITTEIFEKLRSKKKVQRDQTEADRWKDIFKLLFPGEIIPSPYFEAVQEEMVLSPDSRELADYEEYCRRELPRTFRAALEEIVHNESQPLEESIRNQLMNIIRDCQDRVFSRYRLSSSTTAAVGSPSRSAMLPRSPVMDRSQESIDSISMALNADTEARVAPPFFQPPPPQAHLRSRLEVSDIQLNTSKAPDASVPSDSGYSSMDSGNTSGIVSSSSNICDNASLSDSRSDIASAALPASVEATWNMNNQRFNANGGNGVSESKDTGTFEGSFNNPFDNDFDSAFGNSFDNSQYGSQLTYGNAWDPSMDNLGMENLFPSNETL